MKGKVAYHRNIADIATILVTNKDKDKYVVEK